MSTSNNQATTGAEARKRLTTSLNRMVQDGHIAIPEGHYFQLDENGVPVVVVAPIPQVSPMRMFQIKDHIRKNLRDRSTHWNTLLSFLNMVDAPSFTHMHLWDIIKDCHAATMKDCDWIHHVCDTLEKSPEKLLTFSLKDCLAPCIGRFVGTCNDSSDRVNAVTELNKLSHDHFGFYILIVRIHELYDEVIKSAARVEASSQNGKHIAQCLRALSQALDLSDAKRDLEAVVFVSLRQRCAEILDGNRERSVSPEPEPRGIYYGFNTFTPHQHEEI
ncbi:hypothetical protein FHETE_4295 [Fusarium heterosporum]|uniref:Uncharacterized protein n=1 Tax=Fusarium heterosporum TaxID=42747 RepID=A0A8H5TL27_FUSHE|nr:hypothetical protein FHETE_4295 [Fusarium heterosporum]